MNRSTRPWHALAVVAVAAGAGSGGGNDAATTATKGTVQTTAAGTRLVTVNVSAAGCTPSTTRLPAGPVTFQVLIADQNRVTEVELLRRPIVLAELENLSISRSRASFTLV